MTDEYTENVIACLQDQIDRLLKRIEVLEERELRRTEKRPFIGEIPENWGPKNPPVICPPYEITCSG